MKPPKNPAAVALGRLGGKKGVKNPTKARTSEQARAAVMARWAKHKPTQPPRSKRKKGELNK